ncbi:hypothetical protein P280DRAFT_291059 [Massarina eburnea CBS 473.64]|uniref:Uncharacterized protein n=1 Tax=Massarina eburnea CBS 473.64 TaxID=1395130 RepID=A0A6A6S424_9PLEO|nr:hypothetical protein P280DRAFT_291059 [Massarina eburnea CBS 473.64]
MWCGGTGTHLSFLEAPCLVRANNGRPGGSFRHRPLAQEFVHLSDAGGRRDRGQGRSVLLHSLTCRSSARPCTGRSVSCLHVACSIGILSHLCYLVSGSKPEPLHSFRCTAETTTLVNTNRSSARALHARSMCYVALSPPVVACRRHQVSSSRGPLPGSPLLTNLLEGWPNH